MTGTYTTMNNTSVLSNTTDGYMTPFCHNLTDKPVCIEKSTEWVITGFNLLNAAVNIIHMVMIRRLLPQLKGGVFYQVLMFTSAADILNALAFILQINCEVRMATIHSQVGTLVLSVLTQSTLYYKYNILLFSAIDRWLSMYRPFTYKSQIFVSKFTIWICLSFFSVTLIAFVKDLTFMDDICLDSVFGLNNCSDGSAVYLCIGAASLHFALVILFMALIARELKSMKERVLRLKQRASFITLRSKHLRRAANYVIITVVLYILCFVPYLLYVILDVAGLNDIIDKYRIKEIGGVLNSCYGLFNVVALGITHRVYRTKIKDVVLSTIKRQ